MKQESMKRKSPGSQNPATLVVERFNVFLIKPGHVARVITARGMTKEERHLYRTHIYL